MKIADTSFNKTAALGSAKSDSIQAFSCEFCEFFKNTFFTENFGTTAYDQNGKNHSVQILTNFANTKFLIYLWNYKLEFGSLGRCRGNRPEVFCKKVVL